MSKLLDQIRHSALALGVSEAIVDEFMASLDEDPLVLNALHFIGHRGFGAVEFFAVVAIHQTIEIKNVRQRLHEIAERAIMPAIKMDGEQLQRVLAKLDAEPKGAAG